jgi:GT2 family glycosyltransferase
MRTLKTLMKFLKPSGHVVATIPNIAHGSVRLLLLTGRFDYGSSGLLDSTHLKFYTRKTMGELFTHAGLQIVEVKDIRCEIFSTPDIGISPNDFPAELIDSIKQDPNVTVYQFAVKAKPLGSKTQTPEAERLPDPLAGLREIILRKNRQIMDLRARLRSLEDLNARIKRMEDSLGWKLAIRYRTLNDRWSPSGTRRRAVADELAVALNIIVDEGLRSLFRRMINRYVSQRRQFFELSRNEQYQIWVNNNRLTRGRLLEMQTEISQFSYKPKISIIMPVYNTQEKWLRVAIDSVVNQVYSDWELCIVDDASTKKGVKKILDSYRGKDRRIKIRYLNENLGISGASNQALTMTSGDFVGFLDHDDELTRDALFEVVKLLNQDPNLDLIYSDEDKKNLRGRKVEPFFKPDWSPDLLLSMNYIAHFSVIRKNLMDEVGGFKLGFEGSQDHDLILRITELTDKIGHIPRPLYSWRKVPGSAAASTEAKPYAREAAKKALREALNRRGLPGEVTDGFRGARARYRVRYSIRGTPLVSIIIPTKDRHDLLKHCIESIESNTCYKNYEIVIVDNKSIEPATLDYLKSQPHTVVRFEEPFNFSQINNFCAKHAKGEHLLFSNNDIEVVDGDWLGAMLEHSQRAEVGMVGGLLLYPNDETVHAPSTIQHAGVIVGVGGVAGHAFKYKLADDSQYFDLHRVIRNCTAVTAACAMMKRSVFEEVGGFDENLKVAFGDIDLCLRVREKGYRIVYTPHAVLRHHESATRGKMHPFEDETYMINRWRSFFIRGDPYYNPNLTLLKEDYSLASKGSVIRPLSVLLDIYHLRPDLRRACPEARNGDYQRLIDWAAISGVTVDTARAPLRPYGSYYAANTSDRKKPLAVLVEVYNSRTDLQSAYPEVLMGKFEGLITWANRVLVNNLGEEAYSTLKPYEASFRSLMEYA